MIEIHNISPHFCRALPQEARQTRRHSPHSARDVSPPEPKQSAAQLVPRLGRLREERYADVVFSVHVSRFMNSSVSHSPLLLRPQFHVVSLASCWCTPLCCFRVCSACQLFSCAGYLKISKSRAFFAVLVFCRSLLISEACVV